MIRRAISSSNTFIKYADNEKCIDCVHCVQVVSKEPVYVCRKFGVKNLVTGSVSYQEAVKCRNSQYMCSIFGTFFVRKL
jgi:Fe-S-cluster-containing hydrogenase component 2